MIKKTDSKVLVYFLGKSISAAVSLAIIPLFIKWFGEENYGKYVIVYVTFLIFISGSIGWINQSIIKYHGDYEDRNAFYKKAHNITFSISLLTSIPLLIVTSFSIEEKAFLFLFLMAICYVTACLYTSKLIETQAELKSIKYTTAEIIRLLSFILSVYVLKSLLEIDVLELLFLSLYVSYSLAYLFLVKKIKMQRFKVDFFLVKKFLSFGLPLSVWMIFSPSANGIEKYILKSYMGVVALAQYAAVYDVVFKVFTQLVNPINSVYKPLLMNIHSSGDEKLFNKTLKRGLISLMLLCMPALGLLYLFQDFILLTYLGFTNQNTIILLKKIIMPLAISAIIWQVSIILQKRIEALEKTKTLALYVFLVVLISSFFSIWLLPKYGMSILSYINLSGSIVYFLLIYGTIKFYSGKS